MRNRFSVGSYIVFALIAIGLLVNFTYFFIPIVVLGTIFLLYKYPPSSWRKVTMYRKDDRKRRNSRFRVINGSKRDGYDEPPRYH
ncbi:hypothetical protein SD70_08775 [Gordoniibacillus kamchatkensis]|uniref:Uncharacterized protein n=1 Tax=Gordoniibacillus kamchatkensis TaxID=1590651 RepID=A0ABR5AKT0_9BACL|nr:hypothetical protein [Paenibacillus sp. VKM B-2647]KIL41125.1 hypothetical protein SD70_08775 [Paenibacillus sp. VKM B-2647]